MARGRTGSGKAAAVRQKGEVVVAKQDVAAEQAPPGDVKKVLPKSVKRRPRGKRTPAAKANGAPIKEAAARAARRNERRLAGIRAAAGELSRTLDEIAGAREAVEGRFERAAQENLTRARGALGVLARAAEAGPLLDVRRLEKDLSSLVERCGELGSMQGSGRKRDLLAVDDCLGEAARMLEMSLTATAAENLRLLSDRLAGMEALRQTLQESVRQRFNERMERSRDMLASLEEEVARAGEDRLVSVSRELEGALALGRAFPASKLRGKPRDLYGIDGLVKRLVRRLDKVNGLLAVRTEETDG